MVETITCTKCGRKRSPKLGACIQCGSTEVSSADRSKLAAHRVLIGPLWSAAGLKASLLVGAPELLVLVPLGVTAVLGRGARPMMGLAGGVLSAVGDWKEQQLLESARTQTMRDVAAMDGAIAIPVTKIASIRLKRALLVDAVRGIGIDCIDGEKLDFDMSGDPIAGTAPSAASALFACYPHLCDAAGQPPKRDAPAARPATPPVAQGRPPGGGPYRTESCEAQEPAPFFPPPPKKGG